MKRRRFLRLRFSTENLFVGARWKRGWCGFGQMGRTLDVWVCPLPMVTVHFGYWHEYAVVFASPGFIEVVDQ